MLENKVIITKKMLKSFDGVYFLPSEPASLMSSVKYTLDYAAVAPPELYEIIKKRHYFAFAKYTYFDGEWRTPTLTRVELCICPEGSLTLCRDYDNSVSDFVSWSWKMPEDQVHFSLSFEINHTYSVDSSEQLDCDKNKSYNGYFACNKMKYDSMQDSIADHNGYNFEDPTGYNALVSALKQYVETHG